MNEKMLPRLTDPRPFLSRYFLTMADRSPKTILFWPARATTSSGRVQKDASALKYAQLSRVLLTFSRGAFDSSDSLLAVKEGVVVQELVVEGGVGVLRDQNDERGLSESRTLSRAQKEGPTAKCICPLQPGPMHRLGYTLIALVDPIEQDESSQTIVAS